MSTNWIDIIQECATDLSRMQNYLKARLSIVFEIFKDDPESLVLELQNLRTDMDRQYEQHNNKFKRLKLAIENSTMEDVVKSKMLKAMTYNLW